MTSKIINKKKLIEKDESQSQLKMTDNKTGEGVDYQTPESKAISKQEGNIVNSLDDINLLYSETNIKDFRDTLKSLYDSDDLSFEAIINLITKLKLLNKSGKLEDNQYDILYNDLVKYSNKLGDDSSTDTAKLANTDKYFNSILNLLKKSSSKSQFENLIRSFLKDNVTNDKEKNLLEQIWGLFNECYMSKSIEDLNNLLNNNNILKDVSEQKINNIFNVISDYKIRIENKSRSTSKAEKIPKEKRIYFSAINRLLKFNKINKETYTKYKNRLDSSEITEEFSKKFIDNYNSLMGKPGAFENLKLEYKKILDDEKEKRQKGGEKVTSVKELYDVVLKTVLDSDVLSTYHNSNFNQLDKEVKKERTQELVSEVIHNFSDVLNIDDTKNNPDEDSDDVSKLNSLLLSDKINIPNLTSLSIDEINTYIQDSNNYNYNYLNKDEDINEIIKKELNINNFGDLNEKEQEKVISEAKNIYDRRVGFKKLKNIVLQFMNDPREITALPNDKNKYVNPIKQLPNPEDKPGHQPELFNTKDLTRKNEPSRQLEPEDITSNYLGTPEMEYGIDKEKEPDIEYDKYYQSNSSKDEKESNKSFKQIIHDNPVIDAILDNGKSSKVKLSEIKEIKKLISEKNIDEILKKFNYSDINTQKCILEELEKSDLDDSFIKKIIINITSDNNRKKLIPSNKVEDTQHVEDILSKERTDLNNFKDEKSFKATVNQSIKNELTNHENLLLDIYTSFKTGEILDSTISKLSNTNIKLSSLQLIESRSGKEVKASVATNVSRLLKLINDEDLKNYILNLFDYGVPSINKIYTLYNVRSGSGEIFSKILSITPDESSYNNVEEFVRRNLGRDVGDEELFCETYSEITTILFELANEASDIIGLDTVVVGQFLNIPSDEVITNLKYSGNSEKYNLTDNIEDAAANEFEDPTQSNEYELDDEGEVQFESLINYKKDLLKLVESSESTLNKLTNELNSLKYNGWEVSTTRTSAPQNFIGNKLNESPTFSEDLSELDNGINLSRLEYTRIIAILNDSSIVESNGLSDSKLNIYKSLSTKGVTVDQVDFLIISTYVEFNSSTKTDLKPTNSINIQIYKKQI